MQVGDVSRGLAIARLLILARIKALCCCTRFTAITYYCSSCLCEAYRVGDPLTGQITALGSEYKQHS